VLWSEEWCFASAKQYRPAQKREVAGHTGVTSCYRVLLQRKLCIQGNNLISEVVRQRNVVCQVGFFCCEKKNRTCWACLAIWTATIFTAARILCSMSRLTASTTTVHYHCVDHSLTHSRIHSFIHSLIHSFTHSLFHSFFLSFFRSFFHLLIHSFTPFNFSSLSFNFLLILLDFDFGFLVLRLNSFFFQFTLLGSRLSNSPFDSGFLIFEFGSWLCCQASPPWICCKASTLTQCYLIQCYSTGESTFRWGAWTVHRQFQHSTSSTLQNSKHYWNMSLKLNNSWWSSTHIFHRVSW
jgi:hypothetical protein